MLFMLVLDSIHGIYLPGYCYFFLLRILLSYLRSCNTLIGDVVWVLDCADVIGLFSRFVLCFLALCDDCIENLVFRRVRKISKNDYLRHVRPSDHMLQLSSH
jgi:prepilin signal peptidase PulO-like enzyme (type II secretory pathway)